MAKGMAAAKDTQKEKALQKGRVCLHMIVCLHKERRRGQKHFLQE